MKRREHRGSAVAWCPVDRRRRRRLAREAGFDPRLVVETEALVCRPELLVDLEVLSARAGDVQDHETRAGAVGTSSR